MTNIVWLALFFLLLGLFLEILARYVIRRGKYYVYQPGRRDLIELDMNIMPTSEPIIRIAINSDGERGSPPPKTADKYRVLLCGGSSAGCLLLDQETSLGGLIESRLNSTGKFRDRGVHVGTVGKAAIDSRSLHRILTHLLPQYERLDAILVMVGASDVLRWLEMGAPIEKAAPVQEIRICFEQNPETRMSLHPRRWGLARLLSRKRSLALRHRKDFGERYQKARNLRANAEETRSSVPNHDAVLQVFDTYFRKVIELSQKHAKTLVIARQPWFDKAEYSPEELAVFWNGSVGNAYYGKATIFYTPQVICELMRALDQRADDICQELGVVSVDCNSVLSGSLEHYIDQFHFTPKGCQVVADAISEKILVSMELE